MLTSESLSPTLPSRPRNESVAPAAIMVLSLRPVKSFSELLDPVFLSTVLTLGFERIGSGLRHEDRCERVQADEVVIHIGPSGSLKDVATIAERLIDLCQRAYVVQGQMMYLEASVGIAVGSPHDQACDELLSHAHMAAALAKLGDPGTVTFFQNDMEERVLARRSLASDLRKALLLRQLEVHYQPQVSLPTCRLVGFEALLRWKHPKLGWISPATFIPLAEEIGIIGTIGSWVLRTACRQAALLPDSIVVAVNVSPIQIMNASLLEAVESALSLAQLPARRLEVEITEGVLLERSSLVRSTLDRLHQLGVQLALDDFGTSYSSLGRLANLPFDRIKIDRSLVGTGDKNRAIVRAIAMLGTGLGMSSVIEGIECEEQLASACEDGCNTAQGFLFGKAIPPSHLPELLAKLHVASEEV